MTHTNVSHCRRFVVVDALYIDRNVFEALARWGREHGLGAQDAIQVALCAFTDRVSEHHRVQAKLNGRASSPEQSPDARAIERLERTER